MEVVLLEKFEQKLFPGLFIISERKEKGLIFANQQVHHRINKKQQQWPRKAALHVLPLYYNNNECTVY